MQIHSDVTSIPDDAKGAVIAIGNFDGVHKGHQALLNTGKEKAKELEKPFGILTFEPHPRRLFRPDEPPGRITPRDVKIWRLEEEGVDIVYTIPFDWDFASQSAEDFIRKILKEGISASHVIIGYDFHFGQMRKGKPKHIEQAGIPTTIIEKQEGAGGLVLSSSRVRENLRHGKIKEANEILGWDWEIRGKVIKGDQRGRELGYPTANLKLNETIHPAYGIYAAMVNIADEDKWHKSAVNIGIRPMFEVPVAQVEAHILDFDRDIYGKTLRVKLVERLRSEAKFNSLDDLIQQMEKDCTQARSVLG